MAQKGGTYTIPKETRPSPQPKKTSSHASGQADPRNDSDQWEVVAAPDDQQDPSPETDNADTGNHNHHTNWTSTHFDLRLGWGKWKITVFSFDMNTRI